MTVDTIASRSEMLVGMQKSSMIIIALASVVAVATGVISFWFRVQISRSNLWRLARYSRRWRSVVRRRCCVVGRSVRGLGISAVTRDDVIVRVGLSTTMSHHRRGCQCGRGVR